MVQSDHRRVVEVVPLDGVLPVGLIVGIHDIAARNVPGLVLKGVAQALEILGDVRAYILDCFLRSFFLDRIHLFSFNLKPRL